MTGSTYARKRCRVCKRHASYYREDVSCSFCGGRVVLVRIRKRKKRSASGSPEDRYRNAAAQKLARARRELKRTKTRIKRLRTAERRWQSKVRRYEKAATASDAVAQSIIARARHAAIISGQIAKVRSRLKRAVAGGEQHG